MFRKIKKIHFIGIGGVGMCGIAEVLLNLGYMVSGSDVAASERTKRLETLGGKIYIGHKGDNVIDSEVVVISSAVKDDNDEVKRARDLFIPVIPRAEMLAELMRLKYGIAIAGAHGKTSTTSLVSTVINYAGLDPTVVIGGKLKSLGSNAKLGQGEFLIAEADESDGSFLKLTPTITVVTNIDNEHLDYYKNIDAIKEAFLNFINKVPFYGVSIICLDEPYIQQIIPGIKKKYITYGMTQQADYCAGDISLQRWNTYFHVRHRGESLGKFCTTIPGIHNVYNSLAAIAVCRELDIPLETIREGLKNFTGTERRLELKGEKNGISVIDDYGHHPTEVKATLAALKRGFDGKIIVIFQPHRYSRTADHMDDFGSSFYDADHLFLLNIYSAGEKPIEGITSMNLVELVKKFGHKNASFEDNEEIAANKAASIAQPGDVILTLGAGSVWKLGEKILEKL